MNRRGNEAVKEEVLVYLAQCPEHGPEHRIYDEQDIWIAGCIRAIEAELERETERSVRLGVINAKKTVNGTTFRDRDIAAFPTRMEHDWRTGRLSPAYGRSELEREIYMSEVRAAQSLLAGWKRDEEGMHIAFVPKRVRVGVWHLWPAAYVPSEKHSTLLA